MDPGKTRYRDLYHEKEVAVEARFFIWHAYYTPRWNYKHGTTPTKGSESAYDEYLWTGRDVASVHAIQWQPTVEFPVEVYEEDEKV